MGSSEWWVCRSGGFDEWVRRNGFEESALGGSRTRSVLGGSVLGSDNLDGGIDELPTTTMGAISLVLGAMTLVLLVRSPCCFSLFLLFSWGVIHLKVK